MALSIDVIQQNELDAELGELLDLAFQVPSGAHYLDDFPIWSGHFGDSAHLLRIGVFSDDGGQRKLVGSTGVALTQLKTGGGRTLPVALLGAVSTAKEFRGKGIASQIVEVGVQWALERNAAMVLLWGSEYDLYKRLGFEPCGNQARLPLASFNFPSSAPGPFREVHEGWNPNLARLLEQREGGLAITPKSLELIAAHKNVRWFWTGSSDRPTAYCAYGRGIDLPGMVHEWGGEKSSLLSIFDHVLKMNPQAELLGSPRLFQQHGFLFEDRPLEFLCLARILDPGRVFASYAPGRAMDFELVKSLGPNELSRLFFGPVAPGQRVPEPFPLPLWIWGLDAA